MSSHNIPAERLNTVRGLEGGLTASQVLERRTQYGSNDIIESPPHPWWGILIEAGKDPMLWFFAGASALYAFVGQTAEAVTLLAAILPLLGMDIYLHRRTQASTAGLTSQLAAEALVIRDGTLTRVSAHELVPGDLMQVEAGKPLPADGIFLSGAEIQVDESALSGEAYPVPKRPFATIPAEATGLRCEDSHWAYAGARMLTGTAQVRILFTGRDTLYGQIVRSAIQGSHDSTPLQRAITGLVKVLLVAAIAVCILLASVRLAQGHSWLDALISAVTLATAAIPEEFPVVFTFYLGVGVYRLAQRHALVRRAVTVENIGRLTCICSDKTGTITAGQLELTHLLPAPTIDERQLLEAARLASRHDSGDPLDEALFRLPFSTPPNAVPPHRLATFPFTEDRKRETALFRLSSGAHLAVAKGAAETLFPLCRLTPAEQAHWHSKLTQLAAEAHKVVAVASRPLADLGNMPQEPTAEFDFLGLLAFEDPPRPEVPEAVAACHAANIHVMMVTGDHPLTAQAIAREIGLGAPDPQVLLGDELEELLQSGRAPDLRTIQVIARAKPAQKLRLVQALQQAGEIVAVTGDGVNDVPALQAADIGIAMGERGTQSAREVASFVLLDDNFRTIVVAIGEGRQLFRNLQRSFQYLLLTHLPLILTATLIPLAGQPLLYLPLHIVWLEILIHPTAMLVFQDQAVGKLLPESSSGRSAKFFTRRQGLLLLAIGLVIAALVTAGYVRSLGSDGNVAHGRSMALAIFTATSAIVTAVLSRLRTPAAWVMTLGTLASSLLLIQTPSLAGRLHLTPLHAEDWALAMLAASFAGALVGAEAFFVSTPLGARGQE